MNNYPYDMPQYGGTDFAQTERVSAVMRGVYGRMTLGLLISAACAMLGYVGGFLEFMATHRFVYLLMSILEIGIVFYMSARLTKISATTAFGCFLTFAVLNGLTLCPIFAIYTGASIAKTFFIAAGTFGAMTIYGYTTNRDLTRIGNILFMALIGLIICSLVNMFWGNSTFDWIISFFGVIIFVGLTAWDTQKIRQLAEVMPAATHSHLASIGALSLYLDFVNLFLYLLRFFGGSSRD